MKKTFFNNILRYLIIFIVGVLLATLLLGGVYLLPTAPMTDHITESAATIATEGRYPSLFRWCTSQLDNFTDSIMLLTAAQTGDNALESAVNASHSRHTDKDPVESLTLHYNDGIAFDQTVTYSRYWHGYLIFLKPLLLIFNLNGIRTLNAIAQLSLVVILCTLMYKKKLYPLIAPLLITWLFASPITTFMSLQFSSCAYISLLGSIGVLLLYDKKYSTEKIACLFLLLGMTTSYFDLLTYPIVTFGIPAAIYIYTLDRSTPKNYLMQTVKTGGLWAFGYLGMWASKWCVGSIILNKNIFQEALSAVELRTSNDGVLSLSSTLIENMKAFIRTPITIPVVFITLLVFVLTAFLLFKHKGKTSSLFIQYALPFVLFLLLPFGWYIILHNHSAIHIFFANKSLLCAAFSGLLILSNLYHNYIHPHIRTLKKSNEKPSCL